MTFVLERKPIFMQTLAFFVGLAFAVATGAKKLVVDLTIDTSSSISTTDPVWSCVNFDWWPENKCDYGNCPWFSTSMLNVDLKNKLLRNAMVAFNGNIHLRLGGSLADFVIYNVPGSKSAEGFCTYDDFSPPTNTTKIGYELFSGCLQMSRWDELNQFCSKEVADCSIVFGINGLYGRAPPAPCPPETNCRMPSPPECCTDWKGLWDSANAEAFMRYTKEHNYRIFAFELGNELVGKKGIESHITVEDYMQDWKTFVGLIDTVYGNEEDRPLTVVPDTSWMSDWYGAFLRKINALDASLAPDIVTHHLYSMGPGVNADAWQVALNATVLDQVAALGKQVNSVVSKAAPKAKIWLGEGGGCYNSGANNVTNAFNSGFWYLDQMAVFAAAGHGSYCRQTLLGGYYGLLDTFSFEPNPDYYSLLAWSRLMGQEVLQVIRGQAGSSNTLRAYSHCMSKTSPSYTPGGVIVVLINLSNTSSVQATLYTTERRDLLSSYREEYIFSSACKTDSEGETAERELLACRRVLLNGQPLVVDQNGNIPAITPAVVKDSSPLIMKPLTYGFVTFPKAKAAACMSANSAGNKDIHSAAIASQQN